MSVVTVHGCPNGATLLRVTVGKENLHTREAKQPVLVALVDRSGSMGDNFERIMTGLIPGLMSKLKFEKITVITFDSTVETHYDVSMHYLLTNKWKCRGMTYFEPVLTNLTDVLDRLAADCVHLLTISDGDMGDIDNVIKTATVIKEAVCRPGRVITSYAIRYGTGQTNMADTCGLSSVLQFNTHTPSKLIDMSAIADSKRAREVGETTVANLFTDAPLYARFAKLSFTSPIILENPWNIPASGGHVSTLNEGTHIIWLSRPLTESDVLTLNDVPIHIQEGARMTMDNSEELLGSKLQFWLDRIRVLQVMRTNTAQISEMGTYIGTLQSSLVSEYASASTTDMKKSLRDKIQSYVREKRRSEKSVLMTIARVANESAVDRLNSQQSADYLRGATLSATSKGLARRAGMTGDDVVDVDVLVRNEVRAIVKHLDALSDIPTDTEVVSFCSFESTLSGLLALRELSVEDIDDLSATELLRFVHIVGVACNGVVGDYPDPMSWRCDYVFPGIYVSMADITEHFMATHAKLLAPGHEEEITSVIPIFENVRIHTFLKHFAPTILELSAGIGMRRMIARVPTTHMYTICGGVYSAIVDLCTKNPTQAIADTLVTLLPNLAVAAGAYFVHLKPIILREPIYLPPAAAGYARAFRSYFLTNNGITNLLPVLYSAYRDATNVRYEADILRALYSYETYQSVKKYRKHTDGSIEQWDDIIIELLQLTPYLVNVGEAMTADVPAPGPDTIGVADLPVGPSNQLFHTLAARFERLNMVVGMLPYILKPIATTEKLDVATLPVASSFTLLNSLDVKDVSITEYMYFHAVQAVVYHSQQLRMDKDTEHMNIPDITCAEAGLSVVRQERTRYITRIYSEKLAAKRKAESAILAKRLVQELLRAPTTAEFARLLQDGVQEGATSYAIVHHDSVGVTDLRLGLCDLSAKVPMRFLKIATFLIGKEINSEATIASLTLDTTAGKPCWNNGNVLRTQMEDFARTFLLAMNANMWNNLIKCHRANTSTHVYRESNVENRHKHNNLFPSYWALGFKTMDDMREHVSSSEMATYSELHSIRGCCGFQ